MTKKVVTRKSFIFSFFLLELLSVSILYYDLKKDTDNYYQVTKSKFEEKLNLKKELILETFLPLLTDVQYLVTQPALKRFFQDSTHKKYLTDEFLRFSQSSLNYDQIRLLNIDGKEIIRINQTADTVVVVPDNELQDKSKRNYFIKSKSITNGEVYLSSIDLNIENGEVEIPYKAVVRIIIPVYNGDVRKGVLIINYAANSFLEKLSDSDKSDNVNFFLLNEGGYILSGPENHALFSFMFDDKHTGFFTYFSDAWSEVQKQGNGNVINHEGLFSFQKASINNLNYRRDTFKKEVQNEEDWYLVYSVDEKHIRNNLKHYYFYFTLLSILATLVNLTVSYLFSRFRLKETMYVNELELLNNSLEEKVSVRTAELTETKKQLENKVHDLLSSIRYAKKVQSAILPQTKLIKSFFPNSFILFLPKDIVAGDFYWMETIEDDSCVLFAVADCTGHGVPGAMVSIVCYNALSKVVNTDGITKPSSVLDNVALLVENAFFKGDEGGLSDGMDVSLCMLDFKNKILHWAGANNPLWIIRKDANTLPEIIEYKPNRQPIGKYRGHREPYTNHEIQLEDGDIIYMFSDGFQDQFSESNHKLKRKGLKDLLIRASSIENMSKQRQYIMSFLDNWKGENMQIDDICLLGVKV